MNKKRALSNQQRNELLGTLKSRFEKNMHRHEDLKWAEVETRLTDRSVKLWSLFEMERTGGEPDVVEFDKESGEYIFCDWSTESPTGRRSLCYDFDALQSRKANKPKSSAMDMAGQMGITVLTEDEYRSLQKIENFDLKTSSWVQTPAEIRKQGGAIFCDFRFGRVFTYHNGAESYYASRGFRGTLRI